MPCSLACGRGFTGHGMFSPPYPGFLSLGANPVLTMILSGLRPSSRLTMSRMVPSKVSTPWLVRRPNITVVVD